MSEPSLCAAATVLSVAFLTVLWSCSATTRTAISDDLRFVAQLLDQRSYVGDLHARLALAGLHHLQRREPRGYVHAERIGLEHLERLLLRLHDVRQRNVARLVQPQVGGHDRGKLDRHRLEPAVDFA